MKLTAARALIQVLDSWNVRHIYGIPGSSVNGLMDGLYHERDKVQYVQVRHEGAGAMAASAYSKFSGEIGVCFGSAGPGGSNLINGLYDAKMDRVPLLALVGQTPSYHVNTNFFQEMDEVPLYGDVSVYNRMVTNAEQIPDVVEEAIRTAYSKRGVAVVILPNDLMEKEIDFTLRQEKKAPPVTEKQPILEEDVTKVLEMIRSAKAPVLYGGLGLRGGRETVTQVSEKFAMPIVTSAASIGVAAPNDHENFMGSFGRLGTKPAYDAMNHADLVLFVGSNFPFARFWPEDLKVVQINNEPADIGKQIPVDLGIVADGAEFLSKLLEADFSVEERTFLTAARISKKNWDNWLDAVASDDEKGLPAEAVLKAVREHADEDAFFGLDVGNNTMHSVRMLPLNKGQQYTISGWFATMGVGLPASIAAKLSNPDRQVWSISGDGSFSMNMQEIVTQSKYKLPIVNIVLANQSYGFIQHAQILSDFLYGVEIDDADWAMAAKGMGAISYTVHTIEELSEAMEDIQRIQKEGNQHPILVDAKLHYRDPLDTSYMILDPDKYSAKEIQDYKETYNVFGQPALSEILKTLEK